MPSMAEGAKEGNLGRKRKQRSSKSQRLDENKNKQYSRMKRPRKDGGGRKSGSSLFSALRKEYDKADADSRGSDEEFIPEEAADVYEYEEDVPEEEKGRNRRFDPVDDVEYELPDDFEDEELPSDEEENGYGMSDNGEEAEDTHLRMLQGITGMPSHAFQSKKKMEPEFSEFHGSHGGDTQISIHDLLDPLHGKPGYSKLRKRLHDLEKKPMAIQAPLPKVERERLERKVAYDHSKKDMTKWEPLVKRNREAPTIFFDEDVDIGYSTVGAIACEFRPRTEFEKKMAELVHNPEIVEAHKKDGDKLLTLNKISMEDMKNIQNYRAKMKSLLFRHELKAKRIKKIKSKTFHRMMKKDKLKDGQMNPDAVKDEAMKQEFKRAEERMTLKHKNSSKWAKRILQRGLNAQDDGTRAALSEQLHQHSLLTQKMESLKDDDEDDDTDEDEEDDDADDDDALTAGASKLLARAKEKTLKIMEEDDELPKSGLLSLPFMVRGLKKKNEALLEEGMAALKEYDSSLKEFDDVVDDDDDDTKASKAPETSGRRVFGSLKKDSIQKVYPIVRDSDDEIEVTNLNQKPSEEKLKVNRKDASFKCKDDVTKVAGSSLKYDVSVFDIDFFGKNNNPVDVPIDIAGTTSKQLSTQKDIEETFHDNDDDSEDEMVDGFLSKGNKTSYGHASEGCTVDIKGMEEEFMREKVEALTEEVPEPEKPLLLPGWGEWTDNQKKKGLPKWMLKEHDDARRKRDEALKKRKDSHLKHVIISEKIDKKSEKLHTKALPFPFTSKEVFEKSIRMPIGPEFNPTISHNVLNRPAVVKKPGIIIRPIQFEEVDTNEKSTEPVHTSQAKPKRSKEPGRQGKPHAKGKKS